MTRLLGHDICTQEEFDTFKKDHHDPLEVKVQAAVTSIASHQKLILTAIALSVLSLVGVIGLSIFLAVH